MSKRGLFRKQPKQGIRAIAPVQTLTLASRNDLARQNHAVCVEPETGIELAIIVTGERSVQMFLIRESLPAGVINAQKK